MDWVGLFAWMYRVHSLLLSNIKVYIRFSSMRIDNARDDVWYRGVITASGNRGLGVAGGRIGPELGFDMLSAITLMNQVLLLKTSQGNRSLSWDFLPR